MPLSCGIAAETWLRIPRKIPGEDHTMIMVDLEAPVKPEYYKKGAVEEEEVTSWRENKIHGQFLRQLEKEGVDINGRIWNPELKLESVVTCAAQE